MLWPKCVCSVHVFVYSPLNAMTKKLLQEPRSQEAHTWPKLIPVELLCSVNPSDLESVMGSEVPWMLCKEGSAPCEGRSSSPSLFFPLSKKKRKQLLHYSAVLYEVSFLYFYIIYICSTLNLKYKNNCIC